MKFLKRKVEAGAEFLVTQMFFDNKHYFNFVEECRKNDINIPIIPGIKPISTMKQMMVLPKIFHIDLPNELVSALETCKTNQDAAKIGTEWAAQQCKELIEFGAPVLHFYTMGKSSQTKAICEQIF